MKKLLSLCIVFLLVGSIIAQERKSIVLNVYGAYVFQDRVELGNFTGYARDGFQYGGALEYFLEKPVSLDLKYLRQNTRFPLYGPAGAKVNTENDKGSVTYILAGGTGYFGTAHEKVATYAGMGLGVGILDSQEGGSSTKFAWDTKLGIRLKTSSKVSFKVQATLQVVMATFGSDFYYDAVGIISVPDYATLLQFGLGGGICYTFK